MRFTGAPAGGVRVEFVRTAGIDIGRDTLFAQTDSLGRFHFEALAAQHGQVSGNLTIFPPEPISPVRMPVVLVTSRTNADVHYLGNIAITHPYFGSYGELFYRGGPLYEVHGFWARGIEVEFRRTGGIRVEPNRYTVRSDGAARFLVEPHPLEHGEVIFELVVHSPAPYQRKTISNLRMSTRITEQSGKALVARVGLGPHLPYTGQLFYAESGRPAAGAEVELQRTGGIRLAPASYRVTVDEFGNFPLGPVPLESGLLTADLLVRPPSPYHPFTIRDVRLQTTEDDVPSARAGRWTVPNRQ